MKKHITEADLTQLVSVTNPQYSPDGKRLAYVQTEVNKELDAYDAQIMVYDFEKQKSVQWTFEKGRNQHPRWSPDGSNLVFTSNRDETEQVYLLNINGGEATKLTNIPHGVSQPIWSPDGTQLLCSVRLTKDESATDKQKQKLKDDQPVEIDTISYKVDGQGLKRGAYTQLVLINRETGEVRQLTNHERDHHSYTFSPCGKKIAFCANMMKLSGARVSDVYIMTLATGEIKRVTTQSGAFSSLSYSPDGQQLAFLGHQQEFKNATIQKAWLYNVNDNNLQCLTEMFDVHLSDVVISDSLIGGELPHPIWTKDSKGFYTVGTDNGSTGIYYISTEGLVYPIRIEKEHLNGFCLHPDETGFVAAIALPVWPSELYHISFDGIIKRLTNANQAFVEGHMISEPEEIQFETKDGLTIHGWLIKPTQYEKEKTYPLILQIHGGPHVMYGHTYFHEFQVLTAQGHAVIYVNPRGSHGYGQDFVNRVRGDYGGADYEDIMGAVNYVLQQYDFIDQSRIGVTGGSYGGFMTNWIVSHSNKFKAAVTQRSISNWISFYGVSDIGYFFTKWQVGADLFDDFEYLWDRSPLKYVDQVETPLLILHGERDDRCPIEQGEQLFTALKKRGKEVKLIRFPNASHNLSRNGHPKQRTKRLQYMTDWFKTYL
ncbi:S9 family peptidase [Bacillus sp. CLL-7-23]|uniref:S9 family peptidase n=1 Tax=Bacillus changyiensis TaxID=3004103 RepID=A0ABT4X615_9BACI|nr:S9 family peptidase [Bacillus changyiensis]MDA7027552.1 S9 family peptidase [Bacillus changyiensis]